MLRLSASLQYSLMVMVCLAKGVNEELIGGLDSGTCCLLMVMVCLAKGVNKELIGGLDSGTWWCVAGCDRAMAGVCGGSCRLPEQLRPVRGVGGNPPQASSDLRRPGWRQTGCGGQTHQTTGGLQSILRWEGQERRLQNWPRECTRQMFAVKCFNGTGA